MCCDCDCDCAALPNNEHSSTKRELSLPSSPSNKRSKNDEQSSTRSRGFDNTFNPEDYVPDFFAINDEYERDIEDSLPPKKILLVETETGTGETPIVGYQYTPSYRSGGVGGADCVNHQTAVSQNVGSVISQDPDGFWISPSKWAAAQWDGIPLNTSGLTNAQLKAWLYPDPNTLRGLREHFYSVNPFLDNAAPTVSEIDAWNIEVIRHFRALIGVTTPINPDRCLYLRAQWSTERKFSTFWDASYPGTFNSASGPCYNGTNGHCGATFIPNATDQVPYVGTDPVCSSTGGAEGLININTDIPWSIKLSRLLGAWVGSEGLGGHTGPFVSRTRVGIAWHCAGASTVFRGKWSG